MEKLLHKCVDCIARDEGEGNASTDECNDFHNIITTCSLQSLYSFNKQTAIQICSISMAKPGCVHAHSNWTLTLY